MTRTRASRWAATWWTSAALVLGSPFAPSRAVELPVADQGASVAMHFEQAYETVWKAAVAVAGRQGDAIIVASHASGVLTFVTPGELDGSRIYVNVVLVPSAQGSGSSVYVMPRLAFPTVRYPGPDGDFFRALRQELGER